MTLARRMAAFWVGHIMLFVVNLTVIRLVFDLTEGPLFGTFVCLVMFQVWVAQRDYEHGEANDKWELDW